MNVIEKSEAIKAGLRKGFQGGSSKMARRKCYGYEVSPDGELAVNTNEAKVVCWIFEQYLAGNSLGKIAAGLERKDIPSPTGKPRWNREAIDKLLSNEKYVGDVLLQKTFIADLFSGKQVKNRGELERLSIQEHHPAIVSRELFEAASLAALKKLYG